MLSRKAYKNNYVPSQINSNWYKFMKCSSIQQMESWSLPLDQQYALQKTMLELSPFKGTQNAVVIWKIGSQCQLIISTLRRHKTQNWPILVLNGNHETRGIIFGIDSVRTSKLYLELVFQNGTQFRARNSWQSSHENNLPTSCWV